MEREAGAKQSELNAKVKCGALYGRQWEILKLSEHRNDRVKTDFY